MKKAFLLAVCVLCLGLFSSAAADEAPANGSYIVGDYKYKVENGVAWIEKYNGTGSAITVPTSVVIEDMFFRIRTVGAYAFADKYSIQSVVIPDGIQSIGDAAFKNCINLNSVTFQGDIANASSLSIDTRDYNSYHYKNHSVFYNAGVNSASLTVTFEEGVTRVPAYLFATASSKADGVYPHITKLILSNTVTEIADYAFARCYDLKEVNLGTGLTTINAYAFGWNTGLRTIQWSRALNVIGNYAFTGCTGIKTLSLPTRLTTIGSFAFSGWTGLETLTIPASVTKINDAAFKNSVNLQSVTFWGNFADASSLSIDTRDYNSYHYRDHSVFYNAGVNSDSLTVTFGEGVTRVPAYLFATWSSKADGVYPHVTKLILSDTVTEIGNYAFVRCYDLKEVEMGSGLTTINAYAFGWNTGLRTIQWGRALSGIGNYAFTGCTGIKTLSLPNRLTTIGSFAFSDWTGLETLTIPASVTKISDAAFKNSVNLQSVTIRGNVADASSLSIDTRDYNSYHYRDHSVFYNAGVNSDSLVVTFAEGVTRVPAYLFATCASQADGVYPHITKLILSNTVTEIGSYAFVRCYDLKEVNMGNGLTTINAYAFGWNIGLQTIRWGTALSVIGNYAFTGCTAIQNLSLPASLTTIGSFAFSDWTGLETLTIPASVTKINDAAFKNSVNLLSVTFRGNVADASSLSIDTRDYNSYHYRDHSVFYNAGVNSNSLTVTFEEGVTRVPAYLFATRASQADGVYCHVTDVYLNAQITAVGDYAFYSCWDLSNIYFGGTESQWDGISFGTGNATEALVHLETPSRTILYIYGIGMDCETGLSQSAHVFLDGREISSYSVVQGKIVLRESDLAALTEGEHRLVSGAQNIVLYIEKPSVLTLPGRIAVLEDEAFQNTAFEYAVLPEGLTEIGQNAFPDGIVLVLNNAALSAWCEENGFAYIIKSTP